MGRRSKGGPFFTLINHYIIASENSFNAGDYPNCISHVQSLAQLLKVKLTNAPYVNPGKIIVLGGTESNAQRSWILRNRSLIAASVRAWMDKHAENGVSVVRKGRKLEPNDDDEEEF